MSNDTCTWPNCHNPRWEARGLPICDDHAQTVAYVMTPDTTEERRLRDRVAQLEAIINMQGQPRATPPKRTRVPVNGTVYVLRCGGFVKIGWTSDLGKRMRAYQPDTVLLATKPGTRADERALHQRFAHLRTHGREWYPIAPQITEYAARMVAEHGEPDAVVFAAKPVTVPRPHSSRTPVGSVSSRLGRAV